MKRACQQRLAYREPKASSARAPQGFASNSRLLTLFPFLPRGSLSPKYMSSMSQKLRSEPLCQAQHTQELSFLYQQNAKGEAGIPVSSQG